MGRQFGLRGGNGKDPPMGWELARGGAAEAEQTARGADGGFPTGDQERGEDRFIERLFHATPRLP